MSHADQDTEAQAAEPAGRKAAKAGKAATHEAPRELKPISPEHQSLAQYKNNAWHVVAPAGAVPQDLDMVDGPFGLIARDLTLLDDIRAVAHDGTWMADYVVVDCGPTFALARLTQAINLPQRRADMTDRVPAGFKFVQASPGDSQPGWLVWREADNVLMNAGHHFFHKNDAVNFILEHSTVRGDANPRVFGKRA